MNWSMDQPSGRQGLVIAETGAHELRPPGARAASQQHREKAGTVAAQIGGAGCSTSEIATVPWGRNPISLYGVGLGIA